MIVAVVFGIWLGVVALAVAIDAGSGYIADRPEKEEQADAVQSDDLEVKKGIAAYRNFKMIEMGLIMIDKREVTVNRPRGSHRKVQVS